MNLKSLLSYAGLVFVIGLFWSLSYKHDQRVREIFSKPDPVLQHRTIESAEKEISYLREVQSNLVTLYHRAHVLHTQAAIFALVMSLPFLWQALLRKKEPIQSSQPTSGG